MARSELEELARQFANTIQALLNGTVTSGTSVRSTLTSESGVVAVGTGLSARQLGTRPVVMASNHADHRLYLEVQFRLCMDDDGRYLTVRTSCIAIRGAEDADPYFHYDYERDKEGYTEAHLQILGEDKDLQETMRVVSTRRKKKQLGELHFPVGGRRFRPAVEDIIEFLVDEQLVSPKDGWDKVLARSRQAFREIQLRAAVRRDPDTARQVLAELGSRSGVTSYD